MSEISNINVQKLTIVQQAIASCCGAIITSLFGKANYEAGHRENLTKWFLFSLTQHDVCLWMFPLTCSTKIFLHSFFFFVVF